MRGCLETLIFMLVPEPKAMLVEQ